MQVVTKSRCQFHESNTRRVQVLYKLHLHESSTWLQDHMLIPPRIGYKKTFSEQLQFRDKPLESQKDIPLLLSFVVMSHCNPFPFSFILSPTYFINFQYFPKLLIQIFMFKVSKASSKYRLFILKKRKKRKKKRK